MIYLVLRVQNFLDKWYIQFWLACEHPVRVISALFVNLQKHGIPVPVTPRAPWSMDANLMHIRWVTLAW